MLCILFRFVNNLEDFEVKKKLTNRRIRHLVIVLGSKSDLSQCLSGLMYLKKQELAGTIFVVRIYIMSVHRNLLALMEYLKARHEDGHVDVMIMGAGWAAHLPGMADAILGYIHGNTKIRIVGVGFEDRKNQKHTLAAELSITEVPATRVIYRDKSMQPFVGSTGFLRACEWAVNIRRLPALKKPTPRPTEDFSLLEAIDRCEAELHKRANALLDKTK